MAVIKRFDAPTERFKAFHINADVVAERSSLALAETVGVHNGDEVAQFVKTSERSSFPNRAFRDFAVAEQNVSVEIQFVMPGGERDADANAQTLTERTGRYISECQTRSRMTFEFAAELAQ